MRSLLARIAASVAAVLVVGLSVGIASPADAADPDNNGDPLCHRVFAVQERYSVSLIRASSDTYSVTAGAVTDGATCVTYPGGDQTLIWLHSGALAAFTRTVSGLAAAGWRYTTDAWFNQPPPDTDSAVAKGITLAGAEGLSQAELTRLGHLSVTFTTPPLIRRSNYDGKYNQIALSIWADGTGTGVEAYTEDLPDVDVTKFPASTTTRPLPDFDNGDPRCHRVITVERQYDYFLLRSSSEIFSTTPGLVTRGATCDTYGGGEFQNLIWLDDALGAFRSNVIGLAAAGWTYSTTGWFNQSDTESDTDVALRTTLSQARTFSDAELQRLGHLSVTFTAPTALRRTLASGNDTIDLTLWANGTGTGVEALAVQLPTTLITFSPYVAAAGTPSTLSDLRPIGDAIPTPKQLAVAAGGAIVLALVLGYPAQLVDGVIGERYRDVRDGLRRRANAFRARLRRRGTAGPIAAREEHVVEEIEELEQRAPRWLLWPGLVASAIIGGFSDPHFGLNLLSLRMVGSMLLSFVVFNLVGWSLTRIVLHRFEPTAGARIDMRVGSIGILVLSVVLTRVIGLQPGMVFGAVAGLVFAVRLSEARSALVILTGSLFSAAIAIVAWFGYSGAVLIPGEAHSPALLLIAETLAGITTAGVSSAPLALLPLGTLSGKTLFRWHRTVWALAYALELALFLLTMFTIPESFETVDGDIAKWVAAFLAFCIAALTIWAIDWRARAYEAHREAAGTPASS